jgi:hypothetical protein
MVDISDVDRVANRMESKWGVERLPRLVSDFITAKFDQQRDAFNAAIESGDQDRISDIGAGMIRAWEKLDEMATSEGHRSLPDTIWTVKHPGTGKTIGIYNGNVSLIELRDVADASFPLEDLVKFIPNVLVNALEAFPGSEVGDVRDRRLLDDEIPF